jgi:hypothetical protein
LIRVALAVPGDGQGSHFQFHQPLRGKADHLAQQVGIGALFQKRANSHHLVGHRRFLSVWSSVATKPYRRSAMTTRFRGRARQ